MVLETQFIPEEQDSETDEEFSEYERIYVQSDGPNLANNEETVIHEEESQTGVPEGYNHVEDSASTNYQVVETVHVTGMMTFSLIHSTAHDDVLCYALQLHVLELQIFLLIVKATFLLVC